jgi:succinate dehydrogenase / fumarate reductase cytochrome b subunit
MPGRPAWQSSIGKKFLMAFSGLILLGFVIGHLLGNLLVCAGPAALNGYAAKLRQLGPWLWVVRGGLLATLIVHVWSAIVLSRENRAARPVGYRALRTRNTTFAARTMGWSGALVALYLLYHLLHLTFRVAHPELTRMTDAHGHVDVYAMVIMSFQQPLISFVYILSMGLLWLHLRHGIASAVQSLGLSTERTIPRWEWFGRILSMAIFLGYVAIPLAVLSGVLR